MRRVVVCRAGAPRAALLYAAMWSNNAHPFRRAPPRSGPANPPRGPSAAERRARAQSLTAVVHRRFQEYQDALLAERNTCRTGGDTAACLVAQIEVHKAKTRLMDAVHELNRIGY
eukprot:jgi/Tetstr1/454015/TSEL_040934.t1